MRPISFSAVFTIVLGAAFSLLAEDPGWTPEGLAGQDVRFLASSGDAESPIYAGTDVGLFRYENGAWAQIPGAFAPESLAVEPGNSNVLWASRSVGLFKSTDGGEHFVEIQGFSSRAIGPIAVAPDGTVYAGSTTRSAVYRSTDGGATWSTHGLGLDPVTSLAVAPNGTTVLAGMAVSEQTTVSPPCGYWDYCDDGGSIAQPAVFGSSDSGATWRDLLQRADQAGRILKVGTFAVDRSSGMVYAGTETTAGPAVFRSGSWGLNWVRAAVSPTSWDAVQSLAIDPGPPRILYAGTKVYGVLRSLDQGRHWESANDGLAFTQVNALFHDSWSGVLWAATSDGVYSLRPTAAASTCKSDETHACLLGGRFEIEASGQRAQTGKTSGGVVVRAADQHAVFSLPGLTGDAALPEVAIKMLENGDSPDGGVRIFHGSLTSSAYEIKVTETSTGRVETFRNVAGSPYCGGSSLESFGAAVGDSSLAAAALAADAPAPAEQRELSLLGGRFTVTLTVHGLPGGSEPGTAVPGADRWGYFSLPRWSGDAAFPEVVVKMADFRPSFGRFLVFHAALTDLPYTVTVADTTTGATRTFESAGTFCGGAHADAFRN